MSQKTKQFELPTYKEAQSRVLGESGTGTPLDWFIVENEPSSIVEQAKFRRELADLVKFAMKSAKLACDKEWIRRF